MRTVLDKAYAGLNLEYVPEPLTHTITFITLGRTTLTDIEGTGIPRTLVQL